MMQTFPSAAEEELIDTLSLEEFLIKNPQSSFLIKVEGDSMIEAGIHPKDLVIFERGRQPADGDIVIAEVDGQWVMRYFQKRSGRVELVPANPKQKSITPQKELKVAGVITAVIRKYH